MTRAYIFALIIVMAMSLGAALRSSSANNDVDGKRQSENRLIKHKNAVSGQYIVVLNVYSDPSQMADRTTETQRIVN